MAVLGIDLGTTNSVVATVRGAEAAVIPDRAGRRLQPSIVTLQPDGGRVCAHEALARRIVDPNFTIYSAKRLMGQPFHSEEVRLLAARVPYSLSEGPNDQTLINGPDRTYTVPEVSGMVLSYLRECAEQHLGEKVNAAVITVPANFNNAQRQATIDAGRIAGLEVLRALNEPTAAALAYGFGREMSQRIAVYDFGGGTLDVTILQVEGDVFEVLASGGDSFLGGDDVDVAVVELLAAQFAAQHGFDPRRDAATGARLTLAAEQVKRHLSSRTEARGDLKLSADGDGNPLTLSFHLTRAAVEEAIAPLIARTLKTCDEVLAAAKLSPSQVDEVILVGGSTRIPLCRQQVEKHFGRLPRTDINPDEVVACGAALQAENLANAGGSLAQRPVLLDVTPRALGIAVAGGYAEAIVEKNAPVPVEQTRIFTTSADSQTRVVIQVCQGESRRFVQNEPLGDLELTGLPPAPRGTVKIEVTFRVDTNGILKVRARDPKTGLATEAAVNVRASMSEEEVAAASREIDPTAAPGSAPVAAGAAPAPDKAADKAEAPPEA